MILGISLFTTENKIKILVPVLTYDGAVMNESVKGGQISRVFGIGPLTVVNRPHRDFGEIQRIHFGRSASRRQKELGPLQILAQLRRRQRFSIGIRKLVRLTIRAHHHVIHRREKRLSVGNKTVFLFRIPRVDRPRP